MTREEVREIFKEVGEIEDELARKDRYIQMLREKAKQPEGVHYTDMPKVQAPSTSKMEEVVCDYLDRITELEIEKGKWREKRARIEKMIDSADKPAYRHVLRLRYLDRLTWEEIARVMGYGKRNVQYLDKHALDSVALKY
ncbi:MAG: hypothetical protein IKN79_07785 [Eubacterium sp.]|nr:hypothetical protein [Eubacterium sp.]